VVSYSISENIDTALVTQAFLNAFRARKAPAPLVFHSDQGTQYTSFEFCNLLKQHKITQSFSAPGSPHDNAVAESFFATIKKEDFRRCAKKVLYTGPIDEFYEFKFGPLEYRSLRFEHKVMTDTDNFQGVAVVNYTSKDEPYTRSIEHKHFEFGKQPTTVVSYEYSHEWQPGEEPYYPVNDAKNQERYEQYRNLAKSDEQVVFGGRLGLYRYTDMQDTIISALELVQGSI
jgi:UDP-galactopyranose mutase